MVVLLDIFMTRNGAQVFTLATQARLPSVAPLRSFASDEALASNGSNFEELFPLAAPYVDRILRGEKPADLPVQEPTNYGVNHQPKGCPGDGAECRTFASRARRRVSIGVQIWV